MFPLASKTVLPKPPHHHHHIYDLPTSCILLINNIGYHIFSVTLVHYESRPQIASSKPDQYRSAARPDCRTKQSPTDHDYRTEQSANRRTIARQQTERNSLDISEMPPFQAPSPYFQRTRNEAWAKFAPEETRDADYLWGECWRRFNTMQIPIFDEKAYFDTAIALAKVSENLQDFEKNFEIVKNQQNKAILDLLRTGVRRTNDKKLFTCKAALSTTNDVCRTGCLEHFMRLLKGTAFGWEADVAEEEKPPAVEEERTEHPLDHYDGSYPLEIPPEWETQHDPEWDWTYHSPRTREARLKSYEDDMVFIGTYTEFMAPAPDDGAPRALASNDAVSSEQQHPSLASNDAPIPGTEAERRAQGASEIRLSSPFDDRSSTLTKKRVRFHEDEDVSNHEPKRRKLNDSPPHTPSIPTPPATQPQIDGSSSKKRSRLGDDDDDDDDNDDNNSRKRQRMESLPSPPTPYSSSDKATSTDDLPQKDNPVPTPEAQDSDTIKGERKRRKSKSSMHTPRTRSPRSTPNSRSLRKSKSPAFWELDSSGKPHYISQR